MRDQLGKAKGVNDVMWETIVQQIVPQSGKAREQIGNEFEEESTRRRKRGRV
jgi:pre-rRNA-processing protein IPI3